MDNKFLDKVIDQLVSETKLETGEFYPESYLILFPFVLDMVKDISGKSGWAEYFIRSNGSIGYNLGPGYSFRRMFHIHVVSIYGLTEPEMNYVYFKYLKIIEDICKDTLTL